MDTIKLPKITRDQIQENINVILWVFQDIYANPQNLHEKLTKKQRIVFQAFFTDNEIQGDGMDTLFQEIFDELGVRKAIQWINETIESLQIIGASEHALTISNALSVIAQKPWDGVISSHDYIFQFDLCEYDHAYLKCRPEILEFVVDFFSQHVSDYIDIEPLDPYTQKQFLIARFNYVPPYTKILDLLFANPSSIGQISKKLQYPESDISFFIQKLFENHIIENDSKNKSLFKINSYFVNLKP